VYFDPSLSNNGKDDVGLSTANGTLLSHDAKSASAVQALPAFTRTSTGFVGTSDGWTDLKTDHAMDWTYTSSGPGNIAQLGQTTLDGTTHTSLTLALGFGPKTQVAQATAAKSLSAGFPATAKKYASGWASYLGSLKKPPTMPTARERAEYRSSQLVLAASEDKTNRGAYVASPTMPWAWGTGLDNPSGAYHLVWSRDLYEIATALIAEGDTAGANRALTYLFTKQQRANGSFPQNSTVDGTPHWGGLQLDEVADPIILAWQLHRTGAKDWAHVRKAADFLIGYVDKTTHKAAPWSPQERWENQAGYSPATIASEIAGLVTAAAIAHANHADAKADQYLTVADTWQGEVKRLTATTNGPYSKQPYFLRLTKDGQPDKGTKYDIGDSGPNGVDQRRVVDPSFLELVRLGVLAANDPVVLNSLKVVDRLLSVQTPSGTLWHRYTFDGYGETRTGGQWDIGFKPGSQTTNGRAWPIFAGERGEYNVLAGKSAASELTAMAKAANASLLLPEQVWDRTPPSGTAGHPSGTPTLSATPLIWSHAQFIRLAWSIKAGAPVEQPAVVACRYAGC
jgi:glucoamylase